MFSMTDIFLASDMLIMCYIWLSEIIFITKLREHYFKRSREKKGLESSMRCTQGEVFSYRFVLFCSLKLKAGC
jgi:hypothetical protein